MKHTKVAISLLLFVLLYACQEAEETITIPLELMEEQVTLLQEAAVSLERIADEKQKEIDKDWQHGRFNFISDSLYHDYIRIVLYYDDIEIAFRELVEKYDEEKVDLSLEDVAVFEQAFFKNRDSIIQNHQWLISDKVFNYRDNEIERVIDKFSRKFTFKQLPTKQFHLQDTALYRYHLTNMYFQINTFRYEFFQEIVSHGFRESRYHIVQYYPIAHSHNCYIEQNDSATLTIGLGNFTEVPPKHFMLFVDKDTVAMDGYYGQYLLDTSKKGSHKVIMKANIYNSLIGEVSPKESYYYYEVH